MTKLRRKVFFYFLILGFISVLVTLNISIRYIDELVLSLNFPTAKIDRQPIPSCQPRQQNIVFLKIHKSASSTVASAVLRFALKNNLNIGLPKHDDGHIGWPKNFAPKFVENIQGRAINVLAHHLVYNQAKLKKFMPRDTKYIAIMRHPMEQFISTMTYFEEIEQLEIPDKKLLVSTFLANPQKYERKVSFTFIEKKAGSKSLTKNLMATDLGMPESYFNNDKLIEEYAEFLHQHLDLVMIADHFTVSMVMLRRLLCWSLGDMVTMVINHMERTELLSNTLELQKQHKAWSKADYFLYDYFLKKFWQRVDLEGRESVLAEAKQLEILNEKANDFCSAKIGNRHQYFLPFSEWNNNLLITAEMCKTMMDSPHQMTPMIRERMVKLKQDRDRESESEDEEIHQTTFDDPDLDNTIQIDPVIRFKNHLIVEHDFALDNKVV